MRREWMIEKRESMGLSREEMSWKCNPKGCNGRVSELLIERLEEDDSCVTHPNLVKRIRKAYGLTKDQAELLLPENHRPSSPNYDPDRYKLADATTEVFRAFMVATRDGKGHTYER